MRTKVLLFHLTYYVLSLFIYIGFLFVSTKLFHTSNLGAAIAIAYGLVFLATPILVAVIMRFSLLKWYVDPLAAAEVPLVLYVGMIINQMNRSGVHFYEAFLEINKVLSTDERTGWFFLIGLFIFGLVASFSIARTKGESISYRLISRFIP